MRLERKKKVKHEEATREEDIRVIGQEKEK